jgi:hypothetical protein
MHDQRDEMSVPKSLTLATAVVLGLSTLAYAASRPRYRNAPSYNTYGANSASPAVGSYGGYSSDPKTRALEILADKYHPGY